MPTALQTLSAVPDLYLVSISYANYLFFVCAVLQRLSAAKSKSFLLKQKKKKEGITANFFEIWQVPILENPSQFFTLVQVNLIMTLQIFLPCYCGNEIIQHSGSLNNAIYSTEWFRCSPRMRKYLIIYMEMLQRPVCVRAGNFFEISLVIFTQVWQ